MWRSGSGLVLLVGLVSLQCSGGGKSDGPASGGGAILGEERSGDGTYYAANGDGNCSFGPSSDLDVAALNAPDYSHAAFCGACADVTGPNGTLRIRIVDQCPECKSGDLDLSESAFAKIAEPSAGRVPITWKVVSCDVAGAMDYLFKDGSSQYWVQLQVRNHRLPISQLEWSKDGETFEVMERKDHNYFEASGGFGDQPVTIRITASTGEVVTDELPVAASELLVDGSAQFD